MVYQRIIPPLPQKTPNGVFFVGGMSHPRSGVLISAKASNDYCSAASLCRLMRQAQFSNPPFSARSAWVFVFFVRMEHPCFCKESTPQFFFRFRRNLGLLLAHRVFGILAAFAARIWLLGGAASLFTSAP